MGRFSFTVGKRYLYQGQTFRLCQQLSAQQWLIENQSFGGQTVVKYNDLLTAWHSGELKFEILGAAKVKSEEAILATQYTMADFEFLPLYLRQEAWRRYELLRPLLALSAKERSRKAIIGYLETFKKSLTPTPIRNTTRPPLGQAISASSLERWLKAFIASGSDLRALVPATYRQGNKGVPRLDTDLEKLIEQVLGECEAEPKHRTTQTVYAMVVNRVANSNREREADKQLKLPHQATIYRRIKDKGSTHILHRRASRVEAQSEATVWPGPKPSRVLERVEFDSTQIDLLVVDEEDRLVIGRPTLTYALDKFSGYPFGLYVSFEPSSYITVQGCLLHGILPKPDYRKLYKTKNDWPVYGLPETLIVDNGSEFISKALKDACGQLGIILEQMPVHTPWFKSSVERHFRTLNEGFVHLLPGSTFSNVVERGDYDAAQHACISLKAFLEILHTFILDVYAQRYHTGLQAVPANLWLAGWESGLVPCLSANANEVKMMLHPTITRTLQRTGIEFENLRYQSSDLGRLRTELGRGTEVNIKYDPLNLEQLYVFDPKESGRWLTVPTVDISYTQGLSLWKHRKICTYLRRKAQAIDMFALAEAKQHIQEVVAREFSLTKDSRGRKQAARFLGKSEPETEVKLKNVSPTLEPKALPIPISISEFQETTTDMQQFAILSDEPIVAVKPINLQPEEKSKPTVTKLYGGGYDLP